LFVGRFHRQKNLRFLLEQLARLCAVDPDGWRLALVGDGEERPLVEECIGRLGLSDIATLHGWQEDKNRIRDLYQQADVVVNPSLYEGMPNVVLEAMACGLPVVASAVPGNDSLVLPGKTGYLFNLGDGDAFCAALREIGEKPALARVLGKSGRHRVEEEYSWERVARSYVALFDPGAGPVSLAD
jgi:glycosyltransferase involved in cell wall biosynthesis